MSEIHDDYGPVDLAREGRDDYRARPWDRPMTAREAARDLYYEEMINHEADDAPCPDCPFVGGAGVPCEGCVECRHCQDDEVE
jgi:hypothetical protein